MRPPIAGTIMRTATENVELAGIVIPADAMVLMNSAAANRDPAIDDDPNRFDITRKGLPPILTFGAGVHYRLGTNLARLEIAEAIKGVTHRFPNPRRTGPAPWKPRVALNRPTGLPIAFDTQVTAIASSPYSHPAGVPRIGQHIPSQAQSYVSYAVLFALSGQVARNRLSQRCFQMRISGEGSSPVCAWRIAMVAVADAGLVQCSSAPPPQASTSTPSVSQYTPRLSAL